MLPPSNNNTRGVSQLERVLIAFLAALALGFIVSAAYLPLNGSHVWRQSDVYGHILGFTGRKGFAPFDLFIYGHKAVFDIPVYQYIIAKIAVFFQADPLPVVRFVNAFFWSLTAYAGFRIANHLNDCVAGMGFLFLFATSPLILHFHSVPLPDVMALSCAMLGLMCLVVDGCSWRTMRWAMPLFVTATVIKSPVAFVPIVFYTLLQAQQMQKGQWRTFMPVFAPFLLVLFVTALLAEQGRNFIAGNNTIGFAQDPGWYFGTVALRMSGEFWAIILERFHSWGPGKFGFWYVAVTALCVAD